MSWGGPHIHTHIHAHIQAGSLHPPQPCPGAGPAEFPKVRRRTATAQVRRSQQHPGAGGEVDRWSNLKPSMKLRGLFRFCIIRLLRLIGMYSSVYVCLCMYVCICRNRSCSRKVSVLFYHIKAAEADRYVFVWCTCAVCVLGWYVFCIHADACMYVHARMCRNSISYTHMYVHVLMCHA
jgi:hypothetical protein